MKNYILSIFLLAAVAGSAFGQVRKFYFEDPYYGGVFFNSMSNNGKYAVGASTSSAYVFNLDIEDMEQLTLSSGAQLEALDVSDDGVIVGLFTDPEALSVSTGNPCLVPGIFKDGKWTALLRNEGTVLQGASFDGAAQAISADGKIIAGNLLTPNQSAYVYQATIWDAESNTITATLPDNRTDYGSKINAISDDGSVACGWEELSNYGKIIIWKNGEKVTMNEQGIASVVTANGKFVGGEWQSAPGVRGSHPFIWSEETGIMEVPGCPTDAVLGAVTAISNDGKIITGWISKSSSYTEKIPFIVEDGTYYNFDTFMSERYGLKGPKESSFFTICGMSVDASALCGYAYVDGSRVPWLVYLDEPLASSINNETMDMDIKAYSNPASGVLNIEGEYTSVEVYNNVGTCVLSQNQATNTINISQLVEGVYFAKVTKDGVSRTFKVAVNH